jgi:lipopolysaccharide assembly outer membrane protein LptD (OstA)
MIKSSMKKILMVVLSSFFVLMLLVVLRSEREGSKDLQFKGNSFIEGLNILQKKDGNVAWVLTAQKADFIEDGEKAELSDITMMIEKNKLILYVDKGIYNLLSRNFTAEGEIRAKAKDYIITADSIDYEAYSGEIKTEGWIKVEGNRFRVQGKGLNIDSGQKVRILKDVEATFYH